MLAVHILRPARIHNIDLGVRGLYFKTYQAVVIRRTIGVLRNIDLGVRGFYLRFEHIPSRRGVQQH